MKRLWKKQKTTQTPIFYEKNANKTNELGNSRL